MLAAAPENTVHVNGQAVREAMRRKGVMDAAVLARVSGLSRAAARVVRRGGPAVPALFAIKVAAALGVPVNTICVEH